MDTRLTEGLSAHQLWAHNVRAYFDGRTDEMREDGEVLAIVLPKTGPYRRFWRNPDARAELEAEGLAVVEYVFGVHIEPVSLAPMLGELALVQPPEPEAELDF